MKFYGRVQESARLQDYLPSLEKKKSEIVVVAGRRRIGKTRLILEATKSAKRVYFFVTKKKIDELLLDWQQMISQELGYHSLGRFSSFEQFLTALFELSLTTPLVVIFDEFQNFFYSKKEVYSVFQKVFDLYRDGSSLLFIFSGSSFSLMEKIFKGNKEPLFGRASDILELSYLSLRSQEQFMIDEQLLTARDKILFYSIFDGVPKYWEEVNQYKGEDFLTRLRQIILQPSRLLHSSIKFHNLISIRITSIRLDFLSNHFSYSQAKKNFINLIFIMIIYIR